MKRILLFCIAVVVLAVAQAQPLATRLESLLKAPVLRTSEVGITVYDLTVGKPVFTHQDKKLYRPASIEKLLTGITALEKLGPNYAFTTSVYYKGVVADSVLRGDLYVVGGFDSEFGEREMDYLVKQVKSLPIHRIEGRLIRSIMAMAGRGMMRCMSFSHVFLR